MEKWNVELDVVNFEDGSLEWLIFAEWLRIANVSYKRVDEVNGFAVVRFVGREVDLLDMIESFFGGDNYLKGLLVKE